MLTAFSIDMKNSLLSLGDEFYEFHKIGENSLVRCAKYARVKGMLYDIIQFHCDLTQLSEVFILGVSFQAISY